MARSRPPRRQPIEVERIQGHTHPGRGQDRSDARLLLKPRTPPQLRAPSRDCSLGGNVASAAPPTGLLGKPGGREPRRALARLRWGFLRRGTQRASVSAALRFCALISASPMVHGITDPNPPPPVASPPAMP